MAFLLITATLYLTAPALYSTGLPTFSGLRQPPNPMMYITIPARLRLHACIYTSALLPAELGGCLHP